MKENMICLQKGSLVQLLLLMSNHSICIDSPFFRAPPTLASQIIEEEAIEHEEAQQSRFILTSPQILPPTFKLLHSSNPKTPWSFAGNNEQESSQAVISLPAVFPNESYTDSAIRDLITYSQAEDGSVPQTPIIEMMSPSEDLFEMELNRLVLKKNFDSLQFSKNAKCKDKGLRKLSLRAYEVVQELGQATYKDVANKLVEEFNQYDGSDIDFENKQQIKSQNIKRRVYDAINVLISCGLLKKSFHKIFCSKIRRCRDRPTDEFLSDLNKQARQKAKILQEKRKKLMESRQKREAFRFLLTRNQLQKPYTKDKIVFPFIGVIVTDTNLKAEISNSQLVIRSNGRIQPFGDIDTLRWLKENYGITGEVSL